QDSNPLDHVPGADKSKTPSTKLQGAHLGTATDPDRGWLVAQTGSLLFRRMVFGRWADCQSATQQTASLRYGGSAKMRPTPSTREASSLEAPSAAPEP